MNDIAKILEFLSMYTSVKDISQEDAPGNEVIFSFLYPYNSINIDELTKLQALFKAKQVFVSEESNRKWYLHLLYSKSDSK